MSYLYTADEAKGQLIVLLVSILATDSTQEMRMTQFVEMLACIQLASPTLFCPYIIKCHRSIDKSNFLEALSYNINGGAVNISR